MPPSLVFRQPYQSIFFATIAVWVVSNFLIGLRHDSDSDGTQDRGSKRVLGGAIPAGIVLASLATEVVPAAQLPFPSFTFWFGIATILFGVGVRRYAVWTLGRYFSTTVTVDSTDEVIDTGPYRLVRHPSYTGRLLSVVGLGMATGNWLSFAFVSLAGIVGYGYRISIEERALREELGDEYHEYAADTPYRLVPKIW
ncbi:methyltransferase family protein [Haladaptatus sp. DFWS20]|uniref:methyltransferase family protein n=1 Tax=Haladaptatus sp. DFWS20 TaxID=3403467 RepID=UPI003EBABB32